MQSMSLKTLFCHQIQKVSTLKSEQTNRMFTIFCHVNLPVKYVIYWMESRFCVISSVWLVSTVDKNNDYTDLQISKYKNTYKLYILFKNLLHNIYLAEIKVKTEGFDMMLFLFSRNKEKKKLRERK